MIFRAYVPVVVFALGLMAVLFPGIMPERPYASSAVSEASSEVPETGDASAQQDQQPEDPTPKSSSNRLKDYHTAMWDPIHRQPAILKASNQDCLKCHNEILSRKVLPESPAGLKPSETLAWYQTLDTYEGDQETFHWRHLESPYAKKVMNLQCNFCHQGNDPREEAPFANGDPSGFTLRKMVDPEQSCLKCHGQMNWKVMTLPTPLPGPWHQVRDSYQNDCLSCHAIYRTVRHQVSYLNAENIEALAKPQNIGGDVCYGCHGGRAWYLNGYPYPRHEYPGMDKIPEPHPEWAKDRPTESDPQYALPIKMPATPAQLISPVQATNLDSSSVQPLETTQPVTQTEPADAQQTANPTAEKMDASEKATGGQDAATPDAATPDGTSSATGENQGATASSEPADQNNGTVNKAEKMEAGK